MHIEDEHNGWDTLNEEEQKKSNKQNDQTEAKPTSHDSSRSAVFRWRLFAVESRWLMSEASHHGGVARLLAEEDQGT